MKNSTLDIPLDLIATQKLAYKPSGLVIEGFVKEKESQEYAASEFTINHKRIKFRIAKITPTKAGQFVTLWKRKEGGPIQPFDMTDPFDLFVINVRRSENLGQFVFPKLLLLEKGVITKNGKEGKRALRVYPPWDIADNKQAIQTQKWQTPYFFEIIPHSQPDVARIQKLFLL